MRAGAQERTRPAITDVRSGEVVFLSHCLLNQNTRYPGGASCPGVVESALVPYLSSGTGIVQMPCPEQRTWGGVSKRRMLWLMEHPRPARAALPLLRVARAYLRRKYGRYARDVADDVEDYLTSGMRVRGVVGVAGSPSCGVRTTLRLEKAAAALVRCPAENRLDADWMNTVVVGPAQEPGRGLFIEALQAEFQRRGLGIAFSEETLRPAGSPARPRTGSRHESSNGSGRPSASR